MDPIPHIALPAEKREAMETSLSQILHSCCILQKENPEEGYTLLIRKKVVVRKITEEIPLTLREGELYTDKETRIEDLHSFLKERIPYYILLKKPLTEMTPEESGIHQSIFPESYASKGEWFKASRRKYPFLTSSLWVSRKGEVQRQIHKTDKGYIGEGGVKKVYRLEPVPEYSSGKRFVRASFKLKSKKFYTSFAYNQKKLGLLRKAIKSPHFLFPSYVNYEMNSKNPQIAQVMTEMLGGDLKQPTTPLSFLGKLRAARAVAEGLQSLHSQDWVHSDLKRGNIFLKSADPDDPQAKIADWDFVSRVRNNRLWKTGNPLFTDPRVLTNQVKGPDNAKKNDLFAFGGILYELFNKNQQRFRPNVQAPAFLLLKLDEEWDLPGLSEIPNPMQNFIRDCCLGNIDKRTPNLSGFIAVLNDFISEQIAHSCTIAALKKRFIMFPAITSTSFPTTPPALFPSPEATHTFEEMESSLAVTPNSCCLIPSPESDSKYFLYLRKEDKTSKHTLEVQSGEISASLDDGRKVTAVGLSQLLRQELSMDYYIFLSEPLADIQPKHAVIYQCAVPRLFQSGFEWIKASRREHSSLSSSLWINRSGVILEQRNSGDNTLFEKGSCKKIWDLHSLTPSIPYLRARFLSRRDPELPPQINQIYPNRKALENVITECGNSEYFLFPDTLSYISKKTGVFTLSQIMPKMEGGDLNTRSLSDITPLGKYRIARDIALGIRILHEAGYAHCDLKPCNILLATNDPDDPRPKICDWDFVAKTPEESVPRTGAPLYTDPTILEKLFTGPLAARRNDLYAYGAILYDLFTECAYNFRYNSETKDDLVWPLEEQIDLPKLSQIPEPIQEIVRSLCLEKFITRSPALDSIIETLETQIELLKPS